MILDLHKKDTSLYATISSEGVDLTNLVVKISITQLSQVILAQHIYPTTSTNYASINILDLSPRSHDKWATWVGVMLWQGHLAAIKHCGMCKVIPFKRFPAIHWNNNGWMSHCEIVQFVIVGKNVYLSVPLQNAIKNMINAHYYDLDCLAVCSWLKLNIWKCDDTVILFIDKNVYSRGQRICILAQI